MDTLKEKILKEIRSGQVTMRPRAYFVLQVAALVLLGLVVLLVSVFIFNFILFSIRLNHIDMLLGHGPRGWGAFTHFFPWTLFIIDVALIALAEWLMQQFRFGTKVPVLYLLGGLLLMTALVGLVVDRGTPLNDDLFQMRHGLPPPFGDVYGSARHHDADDTLRGFGIPPPSDADDVSSTILMP
jgi:hypothetical protein